MHPSERVATLFIVSLVLLRLAFPAGAATWNVSNISGLNTAVNGLQDGDTIVLAPGTYDLRQGHTYGISKNNVTITGATGNFNDVTLYGGDMNNTSAITECLQLYGSGITVQNITISGFYDHAIHLMTGASNTVINHVHTLNNGEQQIKGAVPNTGGLIENCLMEQTEAWQQLTRPVDYVGGIDLHGASNFDIRNNVALNIKGSAGGGDSAYFLWNDSTNCTVEQNVAIGCSKGISLGNPGGQAQGYNCEGCIVRNNFIVPAYDNDIGMEFCFTKNCKVYNNTVYRIAGPTDPDFGRTVQIYDSATLKTVNLQLTNNLVYGNLSTGYANGTYTLTNNIFGTAAQANWFVNPSAGDLRLTAAAKAAINQGLVLSDVTNDFDNVARSSSPDIGADERPLYRGDADKNGAVDVVDLGILATNYDTPAGATWAKGDFNADGAVDVIDLGILATNYGWAATGPVPEPVCLSLLAVGGVALLRRRRQ